MSGTIAGFEFTPRTFPACHSVDSLITFLFSLLNYSV